MSPIYKAKNFFSTEKELFKEKGEWGIELKKKRRLFIVLATVIRKDPTTLIRKHADELKVHKKNVRTTIKQDLSPDLNPLENAICGFLENKTNATIHPSIGSLKTVTEEE